MLRLYTLYSFQRHYQLLLQWLDTVGNDSVPIQLAVLVHGLPFPMLKYKYIFRIKYTEAILSNSTRKLLWLEISKMLIGFKNELLCYLS